MRNPIPIDVGEISVGQLSVLEIVSAAPFPNNIPTGPANVERTTAPDAPRRTLQRADVHLAQVVGLCDALERAHLRPPPRPRRGADGLVTDSSDATR